MPGRPEARVEVKGFRELQAGSLVLASNMERAAGARLEQVAGAVGAGVRGRVPVRSGRLRGSVEVGRSVEGEGAEVGIGGGVPYAGWIEFGGTRGRPYVASGRYLYPTALAAEPALVVAGNTAAEGEIRTMLWPTPT